jgi:hypothetical protein
MSQIFADNDSHRTHDVVIIIGCVNHLFFLEAFSTYNRCNDKNMFKII